MKNIQTSLLSAFESSGLTYDELSKRTNLPKSALYRYINGDTEKIPIDRFQSICNELHVDARKVLGWEPAPVEDPTAVHLNTPEARILAPGIDKLPQEQREQALAVIKAMFNKYANYFEGEENHDKDA